MCALDRRELGKVVKLPLQAETRIVNVSSVEFSVYSTSGNMSCFALTVDFAELTIPLHDIRGPS